ncbi:MAG: hypothetical protein M5T61_14990 [Acidimicrobiia bacterium]|nr:hypothetical protein [Acidimicrobiia bacterium]
MSLAALHAPGGGEIRFRPGAGDRLLRLAPLLRPLIELHWTRMVARINHIATEDERLRSHLFGAERAAFPEALRSGLADLQDGACFYCRDRLTLRTQVDHFVPWSRWPNDAIENLVLADSCNSSKSDYLPGLEHVDNWARRLAESAGDLAGIAATARWESDPARPWLSPGPATPICPQALPCGSAATSSRITTLSGSPHASPTSPAPLDAAGPRCLAENGRGRASREATAGSRSSVREAAPAPRSRIADLMVSPVVTASTTLRTILTSERDGTLRILTDLPSRPPLHSRHPSSCASNGRCTP